MEQLRRGMKGKTIKACIAKKFGDFVASIEDESVRALVAKNTVITGGCIASMLLGERVNDFDLYFTDRETAEAVADYYVARFQITKRNGIECAISRETTPEGRVRIVVKSAGVASEDGAEQPYDYFESREDDAAAGYVGEVMGDPGDIEDTYQETERLALENDEAGYRPVFMSTNAITLSGRVQIILRFYGEPDELHANYDYVHCTNYWRSKDGSLTLRPDALESLLSRELRYVGSKYPICSVIRLRKFLKRGWVINAGQILKMMLQVSELDLSDPKVLEDQLTGVDSAYFIQLMTKLKEHDPEKVNSAYLVEIIDRMF
jgi:hypothetical protein